MGLELLGGAHARLVHLVLLVLLRLELERRLEDLRLLHLRLLLLLGLLLLHRLGGVSEEGGHLLVLAAEGVVARGLATLALRVDARLAAQHEQPGALELAVVARHHQRRAPVVVLRLEVGLLADLEHMIDQHLEDLRVPARRRQLHASVPAVVLRSY